MTPEGNQFHTRLEGSRVDCGQDGKLVSMQGGLVEAAAVEATTRATKFKLLVGTDHLLCVLPWL